MKKARNNHKSNQVEKHATIDDFKIVSDLTRREIEKSYSIENMEGTEAYYSNRYGWTLRKTDK
tara:strand:- start:631 stop:819 length:189 start_codon:yes stop_codon:yes gene_type:complete